jgi:hypothetical protein
MSDKKETPVSWLMEEYYDLEGRLWKYDFDHALEMESKKQQKYDEMVAMLEELVKQNTYRGYGESEDVIEAKKLIKEAKEL